MKQISIVLVTMLMATIGCTQSQQRNKRPKLPSAEQIEKMVDELAEQFELTTKQKQNVSSIFNTHFEEVKGMKQMNRENMESIKEGFLDQLTAEIGEDKKEDIKTFMDSKKPDKKNGERPPGREK
ncbi:MAG: hypothetical protein ABJF11_03475 [Reichenbachiella sp.]|uniref:hypothetical protein n=1 Tax=Reichenbachiella sp. TaxID=2184521 RepID=UPI00326507FA